MSFQLANLVTIILFEVTNIFVFVLILLSVQSHMINFMNLF